MPAKLVGIGREAGVDAQVAPLAPARLLQRLGERREAGASFRIVRAPIHEHADAPHPLALLRPRHSWPRRRAANERDELAPPNHSITSSARANKVAGTSKPSAFAVLRLITSSHFVGCCTGKSDGFSPLRIRST